MGGWLKILGLMTCIKKRFQVFCPYDKKERKRVGQDREPEEKKKEKPVQEARGAPSAAAPSISSQEDGLSSSHAPYAARYQTRQRAL